MGVHPREVLKQLMQMNRDGVEDGDEDDEGNQGYDDAPGGPLQQQQEHDDDDPYGQEDEDENEGGEEVDPQAREEQLRLEKERFK